MVIKSHRRALIGKFRAIISTANLLDYLESGLSTKKLVSILSVVFISWSIHECGRRKCGTILLLLRRVGGVGLRWEDAFRMPFVRRHDLLRRTIKSTEQKIKSDKRTALLKELQCCLRKIFIYKNPR
ncbi:hypothetical protein BT93_L3770 [Corymbia citriodora subsp. variegata]|uniref:Uncharacterized protein n=1 Tax=Corymbia citriodora subsp. variegata TaxID=360336 RepID=A0A8T0CIY7_CORYI|nr:hypothetical protein BT93_L3770 [Corymbia citriodora subsp. variegata]